MKDESPKRDIHAETAARMYKKDISEVTPEERRAGKIANLIKEYDSPLPPLGINIANFT